jgi:hypothetical protein
MTWQTVIETVVVGFILYEDMPFNHETGREIKSTGGDADDPAIGLPPK